jgi:hypothetical protein
VKDKAASILSQGKLAEFKHSNVHMVTGKTKASVGGINSSGSRQGSQADPCEHDNEPSSFTTGGEFHDLFSEYKLYEELRRNNQQDATL